MRNAYFACADERFVAQDGSDEVKLVRQIAHSDIACSIIPLGWAICIRDNVGGQVVPENQLPLIVNIEANAFELSSRTYT